MHIDLSMERMVPIAQIEQYGQASTAQAALIALKNLKHLLQKEPLGVHGNCNQLILI